MHGFANAVADWLVKTEAVSAEEKDLYSYAVFSVVVSAVPLFITLVVGLFMDMLYKSILFIVPFIMIRKFSGGFHLKSLNKCLFVSTLIIFVSLKAIDIVLNKEAYIVAVFLAIPSAALIFMESPVDSSERRLSDHEKTVFSRIAKFLVAVFITLILVLFYMGKNTIVVPLCFGIVLPGLLQLPCLLMRNRSNDAD